MLVSASSKICKEASFGFFSSDMRGKDNTQPCVHVAMYLYIYIVNAQVIQTFLFIHLSARLKMVGNTNQKT